MTHTLSSFLMESAITLLLAAPVQVWLDRREDKRRRRQWEKELGEPMPEESMPEVLLTAALLWCVLLFAAVLVCRGLHRDPLNAVSGVTISMGLYVTYYGIWRGRARHRF